jgi:hypothetical protein
VEPFSLIGVPIDSVGRSGGTEFGPAALRKLGLPEALGGRDDGDLGVRVRGEERDPQTGILASADVLAMPSPSASRRPPSLPRRRLLRRAAGRPGRCLARLLQPGKDQAGIAGRPWSKAWALPLPSRPC